MESWPSHRWAPDRLHLVPATARHGLRV